MASCAAGAGPHTALERHTSLQQPRFSQLYSLLQYLIVVVVSLRVMTSVWISWSCCYLEGRELLCRSGQESVAIGHEEKGS